MGLDNRPGHGQAQSRPLGGAGPVLSTAMEGLKHAFALLGCDAGAAVGHFDLDSGGH
jgi:hypothetical protein